LQDVPLDESTETAWIIGKSVTIEPPCSVYIRKGTVYSVSKAALTSERLVKQNWVTGVLTVPFKFHVADHATTGGSTLGAYVGYQTSFFNSVSITPIVASGLALGAEHTGTGFSAATGLIGYVKDTSFQYGLVVGLDFYGKHSDYAYEGKPWLALEIGYNWGL
jgi:hypothetical protein